MGGIFEDFESGGFLAGIFTIGTIFIVLSISSTETEKQTKKILEEAEEIYSLDYSQLENIQKIKLNNKHEYFVLLKKDKHDFMFGLTNDRIPHTQLELEALDKEYENINNRIKISKKEVN